MKCLHSTIAEQVFLIYHYEAAVYSNKILHM
jgi:hypothetical protein